MAAYGWTDQYEACAKDWDAQYTAGRILSQEKGLYRVISEAGEQLAELSGRLRYSARSAVELPAVGDFVRMDCNSHQGNAIIHEILPRKSVFIRKAAGKGNTEQVVAANIDTVFICMSLNHDFNLKRLERYLSVAWESGAIPVIVLTKADLCADLAQFMDAVSSVAPGMDVVVTSALEREGYERILPYIRDGKTVALIGSSGVGKSTLINRLLGENRLDTNGLRNDDKGRHTTTRRELFLLERGGMVIDTPGMRELGLWNADDGVNQAFAELDALAGMCRFRNCSHSGEPHCAVRAAIEKGQLSEDRLLSYQKLKAENRYVEDTKQYQAEKKQKFKKISIINKSMRGK